MRNFVLPHSSPPTYMNDEINYGQAAFFNMEEIGIGILCG
jgi:hypothetical protein